jgi:hypothetical protein
MVPTKNQRTSGLLALLKFFLLLPLHLRERVRVRGAVKIFSSSFFPLHQRERARVRGAVFLLFLFFSISLGQIIEIHQLNVDQGDACFLKIDTFKILIDGGNATKGNNIINPT